MKKTSWLGDGGVKILENSLEAFVMEYVYIGIAVWLLFVLLSIFPGLVKFGILACKFIVGAALVPLLLVPFPVLVGMNNLYRISDRMKESPFKAVLFGPVLMMRPVVRACQAYWECLDVFIDTNVFSVFSRTRTLDDF